MTASFRRFRQRALGVLLFGAVLAPVVAALLGRPSYASTLTTTAAMVAAVLALVMLRVTRAGPATGALYAGLALVAALPIDLVLREQSNSFYTSGALFGGMVILLSLHVAAVTMRGVAMWDDDTPLDGVATAMSGEQLVPDGLLHLPPNEIRVVHLGQSRGSASPGRERLRGDPAMALDDALARGAAWLLVLFWLLVALEHRHVASGALLLVGVLLAGRCLALLPDVLATRAGGARVQQL